MGCLVCVWEGFLLLVVFSLSFGVFSAPFLSFFLEGGKALSSFFSLSFFFSVFFISYVIFLYSRFYLSSEKFLGVFFFFFFFFVFSMLLLIISKSLFFIYLGWDGLGLSSFFLISFYLNLSSENSSVSTLLTNRIGDVIFFFLFVHVFLFKWFSFFPLGFFLSFLFFVGVLTKSAQFPFSTWLPLAMAAPTPISALVHSSTLVTGGFVVCSSLFLLFSQTSCFLVAVFLTVFVGGLKAQKEKDFKKIVALSTLTQVSLIFLFFILGFKFFSFVYLLCHAFLKSSLFLGVGCVLHHNLGEQQAVLFVETSSAFGDVLLVVFAVLFLVGFPFTGVFILKDFFVEALCFKSLPLGHLGLLFFSVFLTMGYSFLIWKMFLLPRGSKKAQHYFILPVGALLLSGLSAFCSWVIFWHFSFCANLLVLSFKTLPFCLLFLGLLLFLWRKLVGAASQLFLDACFFSGAGAFKKVKEVFLFLLETFFSFLFLSNVRLGFILGEWFLSSAFGLFILFLFLS